MRGLEVVQNAVSDLEALVRAGVRRLLPAHRPPAYEELARFENVVGWFVTQRPADGRVNRGFLLLAESPWGMQLFQGFLLDDPDPNAVVIHPHWRTWLAGRCDAELERRFAGTNLIVFT